MKKTMMISMMMALNAFAQAPDVADRAAQYANQVSVCFSKFSSHRENLQEELSSVEAEMAQALANGEAGKAAQLKEKVSFLNFAIASFEQRYQTATAKGIYTPEALADMKFFCAAYGVNLN
jgi:hypothetical protein